MAYSKLYTVESDVPVGYQTVNQLRDNLDAIRDGLALEHGYEVPPSVGAGGHLVPPWRLSPYKAFGKHYAPRFAKAIAYIGFQDPSGAPYIKWSNGFFRWVSQTGTGTYFLMLQGLSSYWARADGYKAETIVGGVGDLDLQRLMLRCTPVYPSSGAATVTPGVQVQTWTRVVGGVGNVELTDEMEFSVTACGRVG